MSGIGVHVAAVSRIYFVVESKLRYSEMSTPSYNPNKTCLAYVHVWFTLSDSPNRTVTHSEPYTLYPECRKECMLCYKASGPILSMY